MQWLQYCVAHTLTGRYVNRGNMKNLEQDVIWIRQRLELLAEEALGYFNSEFPIDACKHASMLLCYHLNRKGYKSPCLVFGVSKKRSGTVGHWWVEVDNLLIDITADQFNFIDDRLLSYKIKTGRQFKSVYCCPIAQVPHYKIFSLVSKERWVWDENDVDEDYLEDLEYVYHRM